MLVAINNFFQTIVILTGIFLIERYVLLEPFMEQKKQRIFYIAAFCATTVVCFVFGADYATYTAVFFGGLNIVLGRKKRRATGFAMMIPLAGMVDGCMAALVNLAFIVMGGSERDLSQLALLISHLIILALMVLFYFKGKKWRKWFAENAYGRRPSRSEYAMILISGSLMLIFTFVISLAQPDSVKDVPEHYNELRMVQAAFFVTSFALSITVIVMVMQGNKQKFYYDKVQRMQFSVISTMADIVENRDANTGGHIKRTAKYVEIIGKRLQELKMFPETLTDDYLSDMIVAAPLHDIGKIHIPDAILNKPGRLTDEEFAIMKTHAAAGRDVLMQAKKQLGDFSYINTAIEMAEYHHEWWNGKGYPNGVSEAEIPLCARIMAVADVFDALTAKRCYKDAMPLEKAYDIIKTESGTHFDPAVADAFLSSKDKVEEAVKELSLEE